MTVHSRSRFVDAGLLMMLLLTNTTAFAYTEEQAAEGKTLYDGAFKCQTCHSLTGEGGGRTVAGRPLAGAAGALPKAITLTNGERVRFETVADLVDYTLFRMPKENPGTMSEAEALQLTAYVLKQNGVAPDGRALDHATAATLELDELIPHRRSSISIAVIATAGAIAVLALVLVVRRTKSKLRR